MKEYSIYQSPIGSLLLLRSKAGLESIKFLSAIAKPFVPDKEWRETMAGFEQCVHQLTAYFSGALREFTLPINPQGTRFQLEVLRALQQIPYGETRSYGDIAKQIGRPDAARAVGGANNRNPLPIIIPCHRVIGRSGQLTGFAGGLSVKQQLLDLECAGATLRCA